MTSGSTEDRSPDARRRRGGTRAWVALVAVLAMLGVTMVSCSDDEGSSGSGGDGGGGGTSADAIAKERGLSEEDVQAAVATYTPSGTHDPYIMIASGGHSGQLFVIGVPSMRILREIAVFTPEPWQGYGYGGGTMDVLAGGDMPDGSELRWGDTHHPAISETAGDYDGQFVFINDKANARVAVVDLRDFETKQLVKNPLVINDHGGSFVTPNTEYVIEGGQYGQPLGGEYAPIDEYNEKYRGMITFWKFDREAGRIDESKSFALELPPYWQDLCDAGKGPSEGWVFCNSINTERATGGIEEGNDPFEKGTTANDTDFLHVFNIKQIEEVYNAGKYDEVAGFPVISLETAAEEKLVHLVPEPKSPHGADVAPKGDYVVVGGKLDPHVSIYSTAKIFQAIEDGTFEDTPEDPYGLPILKFDAVLEAQVELGLGPLHTVFDDQGYAYTSLFLDSAVARWSLGPPYREDGWKLEGTLPVQYNIGHIAAAEGDTVEPDGKYVVALNKWAIDRFNNVGPLLPQNFQLVDISQPGDQMKVLYDLPIGMGEPHYAQIIKADKLKPFEYYPEIGWNPETMSVDPDAPKAEEDARVERNGNEVEIWMTLIRSHMRPEHIQIKQGDKVTWHLTNLEQSYDATHGFALPGYNIGLSLEPGETQTIEFEAKHSGVFSYYCTEFCSALHLEMMGYLQVEPSGATEVAEPAEPAQP
jgi:nitrous-oxide reductase